MLSDSPPVPVRFTDYAADGRRASPRPLGGELEPDEPLVSRDTVDWIAGNDPEADVHRATRRQISVRRWRVRRMVLSAGGQFVVGLIVLFVSSGLVAMAITHPIMPYVIAALLVAPPGLCYAVLRWRIWLGGLPYVYRLLTSLGEDAEDILREWRLRPHRRARRRFWRGGRAAARKHRRRSVR